MLAVFLFVPFKTDTHPHGQVSGEKIITYLTTNKEIQIVPHGSILIKRN